jgi:hypothetical protein
MLLVAVLLVAVLLATALLSVRSQCLGSAQIRRREHVVRIAEAILWE